MISSYNNILHQDDINYILNLPQVINAKSLVDRKIYGPVYFTVDLPQNIKNSIYEKIGLDLFNINSIPMRWIKGDSSPHIDKGSRSFVNTYLMYLTDSIGQLVVDGSSYPITKGTAYVFNEGLNHETIGTGLEPRLLLGPMSEEAMAVGTPPSLFIRQDGGSIQESYDQTNWTTIASWPYSIDDINVATVQFVTDITLTSANQYFICQSGYLTIGNPSLKEDGTRPIITINGVNNYPGLFQNGTISTNGYSNVFIYNLDVRSIGSTLADKGGWVGQKYFSKESENNYIINCCSNGNIGSGSSEGGGIVGSYVAIGSGSLTLVNCSSSGNIGINSGGIVGTYAGNTGNPIPPAGGTITCQSCWSNGNILGYVGGTNGSGGIFGEYAGDNGIANAINCYSTGSIGAQCGGIFGRFAGRGGTSVATNCYSRGAIGANGGGIYAHYAGPTGNNGTVANVSAINCYSAGSVTTAGTGIYGSNKVNGTVTNCYIANGSWSSTNADSFLTGVPANTVGIIWVETTINEPYDLFNMGYTPYTVDINTEGGLIRTYGETVVAGSSSPNAIISGKSYAILEITDGDSSSYETITINSTTGSISTTPGTLPGVYTIYIYNTGSYNISVYYLTVTGGEIDVDYINYINIASRVLYADTDRRSIYNAINAVVIHNTDLTSSNRLNTNDSLSKSFNHKFSK